MWLPPAVLLLSLAGCFCLQGPEFVRGPERGSLMVECRYDRDWENHVKYWCRGAPWKSCKTLVRTTPSEQQKGRVLITDNQRDHLVTVTMMAVRREDTGTYWCGIDRVGTDLGVPIRVVIDPAGTVVTTKKSLRSRTTASSHGGLSPGSSARTHYMLLVFVKVPILLILVGAILWLKGPQRVPEDPWEQPSDTNLTTDLTMNSP